MSGLDGTEKQHKEIERNEVFFKVSLGYSWFFIKMPSAKMKDHIALKKHISLTPLTSQRDISSTVFLVLTYFMFKSIANVFLNVSLKVKSRV